MSQKAQRWLAEHIFAVGFLASLVVAILSEMPWISRAIRAHLLQFLIIGFAVFVSMYGRAQEKPSAMFARGLSVWLLALIAWLVLDTVFSPARQAGAMEYLWPFALAELLRMMFCVGVFFAAAYATVNKDVRPIVFGTLGMGCLVAIYGMYSFQDNHDVMRSIFGNHEQVGSYLAVMLPMALAFALGRDLDKRVMYAGQVMTIMIGAALLLARTRSAWIGDLVGLTVLVLLVLRFMTVKVERTNRSMIIGPALILLLGLAMLVFSSELGPLVAQKLHHIPLRNLSDDGSFADRLRRWKAACRMTYERPFTGWGLGAFPVIQSYWTGGGDPPDKVLMHGTGHINIAHNFWVQWAAETGLPGVILYCGMVTAFMLSGIRVLAKCRPGFSRTLLLGCVASVAASCADMIGAPSYTFPGVSALPFLWMGIGIAAIRNLSQKEEDGGAPSPPLWVPVTAMAAGIALAVVIIVVGAHQPANHFVVTSLQ
jgi:O-antigen ligase